MTMYRWIKALQEPFDGGTDDNGRAVVIFNVSTVKAPSDTFLRELVTILEDAGVATFETDLFLSQKASIPRTGTSILIIATGGVAPLRTQNVAGGAYQQPSAQISVHAAKYETADAKARAAYAALTVVKNQDVTATL
jgi:hypothetical protein